MIESRSVKRSIENLAPVLFFVALILLGCLVYKSYGIPWDESVQTQIGALNYRYIFKGDSALLFFPDRYYGAMFELPILWITSRFSIPRHLIIFIVFVFGLIPFYLSGRRLFHNSWLALLATAILAISPRIFADAFYNSKDIPFMVASIAAVWTLVVLGDTFRQRRHWLIVASITFLHAATCAVLIATRVAGIMIVPLTFILLILNTIETPAFWKLALTTGFVYLALTVGLSILFWPVLWQNPWTQFIHAFGVMSQYPFGRGVLYAGQYFPAENLPWLYLPVWIGITTPLIVLAGILPGIIDWIKSIFSVFRWKEKRQALKSPASEIIPWLVVAGWLAIPVAAIYIFHSVLYDGWRQMFFIYPAVVLISVRGLVVLYHLIERLRFNLIGMRIIAGLILLAGLVEPVWFMVRYHPFENVYFNALAGTPATLRQRFELDYWGLSYKQGIDYILARDPGKNIKIFVSDPPGQDYINAGLSSNNKSRLISVSDPSDANYFVSVFRWHPGDYPYTDEFNSINVRGTKIMVVYLLR